MHGSLSAENRVSSDLYFANRITSTPLFYYYVC
jgi:hypothetical protein